MTISSYSISTLSNNRDLTSLIPFIEQVGVEAVISEGKFLIPKECMIVEIVEVQELRESSNGLLYVTISDGASTHRVVCGDQQCKIGQITLWAPIGTTIQPTHGPARTISEKSFCGIMSEGMLCAEDEIGLAANSEGIIQLSSKHKKFVGQKLFDIVNTDILNVECTPNISRCLSAIGLVEEMCDITPHSPVKMSYCTYLESLFPINNPMITISKEASIMSPYSHIPISESIDESVIIKAYAAVLGINPLQSYHHILSELIYMETGIAPVFENDKIALISKWHSDTTKIVSHIPKSIEHGLSIEAILSAIRALIGILGIRSDITLFVPTKTTRTMNIIKNQLNLIGDNSSDKLSVKKLLGNISTDVISNDPSSYTIEVSNHRTEYIGSSEVIEAIAKMLGTKRFENINTITVYTSKTSDVNEYTISVQLCKTLLALGYNEAFSHSIINTNLNADFDKNIVPQLRSKVIEIDNAHGFILRPSLLPSLVDNVINVNDKIRSSVHGEFFQLDSFEIGRVYHKHQGTILERAVVGILCSHTDKLELFRKLKSTLSLLLSKYSNDSVHINIQPFNECFDADMAWSPVENLFVKEDSLLLTVDNTKIVGVCGVIAPETHISSQHFGYIELDIDILAPINDLKLRARLKTRLDDYGPIISTSGHHTIGDLLHCKYKDITITALPTTIIQAERHLQSMLNQLQESIGSQYFSLSSPMWIDLFEKDNKQVCYTFRIPYKTYRNNASIGIDTQFEEAIATFINSNNFINENTPEY